jgi:MFS transporter, PPP family, 3-phenylpropionic acid transporter
MPLRLPCRHGTGDSSPPSVLQLRALFFLLFLDFGLVLPFLSVWLSSYQGLSPALVGALMGVARVVAAISNPVWSLLADRFSVHRWFLASSVVFGSLAFLLASIPPVAPWNKNAENPDNAWKPAAGIVLYLLFALGQSPSSSLLDALTMRTLEARDDLDKSDYGKTRLFGAVSWGIASFVGGWLIGEFGFPVTAACSLAAAVVFSVSSLAFGPWPEAKKKASLEEAGSPQPPFLARARALLSQPSVAVFLIVALFGGAAGTIVNVYLLIYLKQELNAPDILLGISVTTTVVVEIPLFHVSAWLLRRVGVRGLIVAAHLGYIFRVVGYTLLENPWAVLPIELLHGLTFAAFWAAGVAHMQACAPEGLEASAQGFFGGTYGGAGAAIGAAAGGAVYQAWGPTVLFLGTAAAMTASLLFFLATFRAHDKPGAAATTEVNSEALVALLGGSSDSDDLDSGDDDGAI